MARFKHSIVVIETVEDSLLHCKEFDKAKSNGFIEVKDVVASRINKVMGDGCNVISVEVEEI